MKPQEPPARSQKPRPFRKDPALPGKLGSRIRRLRRRRGWSQTRLAGLSGISVHHLEKIECGRANATISTLLAIARPLNLTVSDLFKGIS